MISPTTKDAMHAYADNQFTALEFRDITSDSQVWTRLTGEPVWDHTQWEYRLVDLSPMKVHPHSALIHYLAEHPDAVFECAVDPEKTPGRKVEWGIMDACKIFYPFLQYRIVEPV